MTSAHQLAKRFMQVSPIVVHMMASALRADTRADPSTVMQMHTLRMLSNGPLTLKQLAAMRPVSMPTLSRSVDAMVRKAWLKRVPHPADRRQVLLQLTEAGQAEFQRMCDVVLGKMTQMFALITPEERQILEHALSIIEQLATRTPLRPARTQRSARPIATAGVNSGGNKRERSTNRA
ncbi:MAG: MarR family winged helix-turn-helix transcriptional regulator [Thermoflexales bacterium]